MKAKLRGKEINCRIIKATGDKLYIEYTKMAYTDDNSTSMYESRSELIKQSVREWVKHEELEVVE